MASPTDGGYVARHLKASTPIETSVTCRLYVHRVPRFSTVIDVSRLSIGL